MTSRSSHQPPCTHRARRALFEVAAWIGIAVGVATCGGSVSVSTIVLGDRYVQEGGHVVADVLWVVDNSGTMSEEQSGLDGAFDGFLDALLEADVDFHLGVITTDVSNDDTAGLLLGDPPVLDRGTEALREIFVERALVGIDGSPDEKGFDAVEAGLSEPLKSSWNRDFLRSNAMLDIVIVSDEDDHSTLTTSEFLDFLDGLKGEGRYRVSALVGDVPYGCASFDGAADPAPRYMQIVDATDGIAYSICSSDYDEAMQRLVQRLSNLQDTFLLTRIADPDSIEVTVDGVVIRNREVDGWIYLPVENAVRIVGTPFPDPGQEIYITYDTLRF